MQSKERCSDTGRTMTWSNAHRGHFERLFIHDLCAEMYSSLTLGSCSAIWKRACSERKQKKYHIDNKNKSKRFSTQLFFSFSLTGLADNRLDSSHCQAQGLAKIGIRPYGEGSTIGLNCNGRWMTRRFSKKVDKG